MAGRDILPFSELFETPLRNGLTKPKAVRGEGMKMVNMGEVFAHRRIHDLEMDRVPMDSRERESSLLRSGDLLFARQSLVRSGAGKCVLFQGDKEEVTFESHIIRCRLDQRKADPNFYFYLFQSSLGRSLIESIVEQVAAAGIRGSDLGRLPVPVPRLAEQKAIAAVLGALDDKIELNRRMNATLEAMARALFKSWFVDFDPVRAKLDGREPVGLDQGTAVLFPAFFHETKVGHIPAGWQLGRLADLCNLKRGHDLPTSTRTAGPIPVISSSGISGTHSETNVLGPGVVTGRYRTIGKVFYIETDYWPLNTTLFVDDFKGNPPRFIFHALGEVNFQNYADKAAVPGVNRNHLHEEPVVLPPLLLRQAFAHTVSPLWALHTANESESCNLATLRDSLLPKLLSGEMSVAEVEKEVAS